MKTFINEIELDYATYVNRGVSFTATEEPIQSADYNNIVSYVKENLTDIVISAAFNDDDREEKFTELTDLARERNLVTLSQEEEIENLIITNITEPQKYDNVISFEITFKRLDTKQLEFTIEPLPEALQQIQPETSEGLQTTDEVNIEVGEYPPRGDN